MKHRRSGAVKGKGGRNVSDAPPKPRSKPKTPPKRNVPRPEAKAKTPPKRTWPKPFPSSRVKPGAPNDIGPFQALPEMLGHSESFLTIIDAGAHDGNLTDVFLELWPLARVYCFDPDPQSIERLHAKFDGDDRVTVIPAALGSRNGKADFHICGANTEMSSLLPRGDWEGRRYYRHTVREVIKVDVVTLDRFASENSIANIDLLKMDVQGGEAALLRGAKGLLSEHRIQTIYGEVMFTTVYEGAAVFWELCRQLDRDGYTLFDIYNMLRSWINRQLKYGDALWVGPRVRQILNEYPEDWLKKSLEHRMRPDL